MTWPSGWTRLNAPLGGVNTVLLLVSSGAMAAAVRAMRAGKLAPARRLLGSASALGFVFLVIKGIEYRQHLRLGELPSTDTFLALYYTLTGLHALHLAGAVLLVAWLAGPGAALWRRQPGRYTGRLASAALYWHFVDAVWICVFILMYLS
jgi:heme/copper-type cytochrome/quinol oxidase subunit 3